MCMLGACAVSAADEGLSKGRDVAEGRAADRTRRAVDRYLPLLDALLAAHTEAAAPASDTHLVLEVSAKYQRFGSRLTQALRGMAKREDGVPVLLEVTEAQALQGAGASWRVRTPAPASLVNQRLLELLGCPLLFGYGAYHEQPEAEDVTSAWWPGVRGECALRLERGRFPIWHFERLAEDLAPQRAIANAEAQLGGLSPDYGLASYKKVPAGFYLKRTQWLLATLDNARLSASDQACVSASPMPDADEMRLRGVPERFVDTRGQVARHAHAAGLQPERFVEMGAQLRYALGSDALVLCGPKTSPLTLYWRLLCVAAHGFDPTEAVAAGYVHGFRERHGARPYGEGFRTSKTSKLGVYGYCADVVPASASVARCDS